jgi:hypothetical protein
VYTYCLVPSSFTPYLQVNYTFFACSTKQTNLCENFCHPPWHPLVNETCFNQTNVCIKKLWHFNLPILSFSIEILRTRTICIYYQTTYLIFMIFLCLQIVASKIHPKINSVLKCLELADQKNPRWVFRAGLLLE